MCCAMLHTSLRHLWTTPSYAHPPVIRLCGRAPLYISDCHLHLLCHAACSLRLAVNSALGSVPPTAVYAITSGCRRQRTFLSLTCQGRQTTFFHLAACLCAAYLKCGSSLCILWHHQSQSAVIRTELDLPSITCGSHTTRHRCEPARIKKKSPSHGHGPTNARSLKGIRNTSILTAPPTKCIPLSLPANYSVSHYVGQNISVVVVVVYILHICSATSCLCVSFFHSLTVAHVQRIFQLICKHSLTFLCLTWNGLCLI
jgi:hypothetical protein